MSKAVGLLAMQLQLLQTLLHPLFGTPLRATDLISAVIVIAGLALASFGGVRGEGAVTLKR